MKTIQSIVEKSLAELVKAGELDEDKATLILEEKYDGFVRRFADHLKGKITRTSKGPLSDRREMRRDFTKRHQKRWKKAFDLLETIQAICEEIGTTFNAEYRPSAAKQQDCKFGALISLNVRGLLVSNETICLLQNGFADGAMGRWRTLHETAVIAQFLSGNDEIVSERYLASFDVQARRAMHQYEEYRERANLSPFTEDQIADIEQRYEQTLERYGASIRGEYGWASEALNKEKPNFFDLEVATGLDHWRPRYRWASQYTHANYKPSQTYLGLVEAEEQVLLIGPSNSGSVDPAHMTAFSLCHLTEALIRIRPTMDHLIMARILLNLRDELGPLLMDTERESYEAFKASNEGA
tara:strand:- start:606 stop:1667 length:1062 start_codon:yes stop_codon:yes gene_type:complete